MASPKFPEPPASVDPTPLDVVDKKLARLAANKDKWVRVSLDDRIELLERCIDSTHAVAREWAEASCKAKGINPNSEQAGETWLSGPTTTIRNLRLLIETLKANGQPKPVSQWTRRNGQSVAHALAIWREKVARETDCPREWLLSGPGILEIARNLPSKSSELRLILQRIE